MVFFNEIYLKLTCTRRLRIIMKKNSSQKKAGVVTLTFDKTDFKGKKLLKYSY